MRVDIIVKELLNNGFYVYDGFLQGQALSALQESSAGVLGDIIDSDYKFGKAARIGSLEDNRLKNPSISGAFESIELDQIRDIIFKDSCNFTEIFLTHEFTNSRGPERNGFLHFDRIWTFKYLYYLSDVERPEHGPLQVVPASHHTGAMLRTKQYGKPYEDQDNRIKINYPEIYEDIRDSIKPIFAKAGTLIMFNTDTFHMGGNVTGKNERKVCRLHMR